MNKLSILQRIKHKRKSYWHLVWSILGIGIAGAGLTTYGLFHANLAFFKAVLFIIDFDSFILIYFCGQDFYFKVKSVLKERKKVRKMAKSQI